MGKSGVGVPGGTFRKKRMRAGDKENNRCKIEKCQTIYKIQKPIPLPECKIKTALQSPEKSSQRMHLKVRKHKKRLASETNPKKKRKGAESKRVREHLRVNLPYNRKSNGGPRGHLVKARRVRVRKTKGKQYKGGRYLFIFSISE